MHAFDVKHNGEEGDFQQSPNRLSTAEERSAEEPRAVCAEGDADSMNCDLLRWAADQTSLSPHLQGILVRLVRLMDDDGALAMKQTDIAPLIRLGERQTRAAIAALVEAKVIQRKRRGGLGGGRVCDALICNRPPIATGDIPPLSEQPAEIANCDNGGCSPLATGGNAQPATGETPPVSSAKTATSDNAVELPVSVIEDAEFVDNSPDACIGTGARAETLNLNTSTPEIHPERTESSGSSVSAPVKILNGSAASMPSFKLAQILFAEVNSRWLDPCRSPDLNTTHPRIRAWMAAGADFDADIVPTVKAVCARPRSEPITLLGYFDKPIAAAIAKRKRAEAPLLIEETDDQSSRPSNASAPERREPLNRATRNRLQRRAKRQADREAIDFGRMESERIP
jgi:hypothetical protein